MLGDIMLLNLCAENFQRAATVFTQLCKDENRIVGVPNFETFNMFLDACIVNQDLKMAMVSFSHLQVTTLKFNYSNLLRILFIFLEFYRILCRKWICRCSQFR